MPPHVLRNENSITVRVTQSYVCTKRKCQKEGVLEFPKFSHK